MTYIVHLGQRAVGTSWVPCDTFLEALNVMSGVSGARCWRIDHGEEVMWGRGVLVAQNKQEG